MKTKKLVKQLRKDFETEFESQSERLFELEANLPEVKTLLNQLEGTVKQIRTELNCNQKTLHSLAMRHEAEDRAAETLAHSVKSNATPLEATYHVRSNGSHVIFKDGTYQYVPWRYGESHPYYSLTEAVELAKNHDAYCEEHKMAYYPAVISYASIGTARIGKGK